MSVILEALKKADNERGLGEVPTMASVHVEAVEGRRRHLAWVAMGAFLVSGAVGLWARPGWYGREGEPVPPDARPVAMSSKSTAPEPAKEVPPSREAERPAARPPVAKTHQRGERTLIPSTAKEPEPPPAAILTLPRTITRGPTPPETRQPQIEVPPAVPPADPAVPGAEIARIAAAPRPRPEPLPSETSAARSSDPPVPAGRERAQEPARPSSRLRDAVARMTLNGLVYSEDPAYRKMYIGGRGYSEGDVIDGNIRVEEIHPDGATLAYRDERTVLRMASR